MKLKKSQEKGWYTTSYFLAVLQSIDALCAVFEEKSLNLASFGSTAALIPYRLYYRSLAEKEKNQKQILELFTTQYTVEQWQGYIQQGLEFYAQDTSLGQHISKHVTLIPERQAILSYILFLLFPLRFASDSYNEVDDGIFWKDFFDDSDDEDDFYKSKLAGEKSPEEQYALPSPVYDDIKLLDLGGGPGATPYLLRHTPTLHIAGYTEYGPRRLPQVLQNIIYTNVDREDLAERKEAVKLSLECLWPGVTENAQRYKEIKKIADEIPEYDGENEVFLQGDVFDPDNIAGLSARGPFDVIYISYVLFMNHKHDYSVEQMYTLRGGLLKEGGYCIVHDYPETAQEQYAHIDVYVNLQGKLERIAPVNSAIPMRESAGKVLEVNKYFFPDLCPETSTAELFAEFIVECSIKFKHDTGIDHHGIHGWWALFLAHIYKVHLYTDYDYRCPFEYDSILDLILSYLKKHYQRI